ncbi:hypothetical protein BP5796_07581 [Coleophoma crateriformis]|uniref:ABM domain-containing protein n=1 Tax=Coleophoma crateriformis TaxID=565419 RepID=A0A3D8RJB3_9HELO|nr:hypothetical protein BP5796_07581 [Coleophoma crateriformis]
MSVMHITDAPKDLVHGSVIITPKPEFFDEISAAFTQFAAQVEANEPDTLVFSITKSEPAPGQEGPALLVVSVVFKNMAAADAHRETSYHKEFTSHSKDVDKLLCIPEMKTLTPIGGYMRQPAK